MKFKYDSLIIFDYSNPFLLCTERLECPYLKNRLNQSITSIYYRRKSLITNNYLDFMSYNCHKLTGNETFSFSCTYLTLLPVDLLERPDRLLVGVYDRWYDGGGCDEKAEPCEYDSRVGNGE